MNKKYFGTDGIRGRANIFPLVPHFIEKLAMALALHIGHNGTKKVVIGKDTRSSCYMIEAALCAGFTACGIDVIVLGPLPTPAVCYLTQRYAADFGIMISASHNPYQDNGIKIFDANAEKLSDALEAKIEATLDQSETFHFAGDLGKIQRLNDSMDHYVNFLRQTLPSNFTLSGVRVVLDSANGAAYKAAPLAFKALGAEVINIHDTPNGTNINEKCGAVHPQSLSHRVIQEKAHIGFSFDGDADRIIAVNQAGDIFDGDHIMAILADHKKYDAVVGTSMSNMGFESYFSQKNIQNLKETDGNFLKIIYKSF